MATNSPRRMVKETPPSLGIGVGWKFDSRQPPSEASRGATTEVTAYRRNAGGESFGETARAFNNAQPSFTDAPVFTDRSSASQISTALRPSWVVRTVGELPASRASGMGPNRG